MHSILSLIITAPLGLLLAPSTEAQAGWVQRFPASGPSARANCALSFDGRRGVLFGGGHLSTALGDTWAWDGLTWKQLFPVSSPSARWNISGSTAYDSARQRVVLFGGGSPTVGVLADTWEWDGSVSSWTQVATTGPLARNFPAMAYDGARGVVVLFGGFGAAGLLADTWEWDGTTWTQRFPATAPTPRNSHGMAYDPTRGVVVLFGGFDGNLLADTWEWNGATWSKKSPGTSPAARLGPGMAFHTRSNRVVLFGGAVNDFTQFQDTWEWDGNNWVQQSVTTKPAKRGDHAVAFDGTRGRMVLFGGWAGGTYYGDVWEYGGLSASCTFRNGSGINSLGFTCTTNPVLGTSWTSSIAMNPTTSLTWLGLAATPGQTALLGGELLLGLAQPPVFVPGTGTHVIPIPNAPALLAVSLFAQGFRFDAPGGVPTFVTLNAQDLLLGT